MSNPEPTSAEPPRGRQEALVTLLGDDDPNVYQQIRQTILNYGPSVTSWLRPHALSSNPVLRRRTHEIIQLLDRQQADQAFLAFCLNQGEDLPLEEALWSLARTRYPEINAQAYCALLDQHAAQIQLQLTGSVTGSAESVMAVMREYLFHELKFQGNESDYYSEDNSYFNRVLDRRTGNPISLCLLYILLGRRLLLPICGIGLPGHFICRYQTPTEEIYIDAFNQGKILLKADCIRFLMQNEHGYQESFLSPVTPRRILLRVCSNLHQIYVQSEKAEEASRLQRYIVALARQTPGNLRGV